MKKYYLTTAIPYANAEPHIGHSLELIGTDVLARAKRLLGYEVYFQTGTDEHGQKMLESAAKAGKSPREYADEIVPRFINLWRALDISYDYFIRSTDPDHARGVDKFWRAVRDNGDIYLGKYEGWYCVPDETFFLESQAKPGPGDTRLCPECDRPLVWRSEESYFFRLSRYTKAMTRWIEEHPEFIAPEFRANEMIHSFLKPGLQDISISRSAIRWGIPVPDDPGHVIYVWFDALLNYITGVGYGSDDQRFEHWWPCDLHVVGKDILKFHTLLWPAMCMAAGIAVPKRVFGHGFVSLRSEGAKPQLLDSVRYERLAPSPASKVTVAVYQDEKRLGEVRAESQDEEAIVSAIAEEFGPGVLKLEKMSKSKGNVVDPSTYVERFGQNPDPLRYFLMREIDFGQDGVFSDEAIMARYNADLANNLGNLLARTLTMAEKYQGGHINAPAPYEPTDLAVQQMLMALFADAQDGTRSVYEQFIDECDFNTLLQRIWGGLSRLNSYITEQQPWALAKDPAKAERLATVLYVLCEGLRVVSVMIAPFMPTTAKRIWSQLGAPEPMEQVPFEQLRQWGYLKQWQVVRGENLFPKV